MKTTWKQTYLLQDGYKRKQYRYSEFHIVYTTLMPLCFLIKQQLYHFNLFILNVGFLSILSWSSDYRYMGAALGHKTLIGMCRLFSLCCVHLQGEDKGTDDNNLSAFWHYSGRSAMSCWPQLCEKDGEPQFERIK